MSSSRQGSSKKQGKKKAPDSQDVVNEAKSLQELLRLSAVVIACMLLFLFLFLVFS